MGITYNGKTKAKASLKLYNQISSFLFEQEFDELKGQKKAQNALIEAKKALAEIINKN